MRFVGHGHETESAQKLEELSTKTHLQQLNRAVPHTTAHTKYGFALNTNTNRRHTKGLSEHNTESEQSHGSTLPEKFQAFRALLCPAACGKTLHLSNEQVQQLNKLSHCLEDAGNCVKFKSILSRSKKTGPFTPDKSLDEIQITYQQNQEKSRDINNLDSQHELRSDSYTEDIVMPFLINDVYLCQDNQLNGPEGSAGNSQLNEFQRTYDADRKRRRYVQEVAKTGQADRHTSDTPAHLGTGQFDTIKPSLSKGKVNQSIQRPLYSGFQNGNSSFQNGNDSFQNGNSSSSKSQKSSVLDYSQTSSMLEHTELEAAQCQHKLQSTQSESEHRLQSTQSECEHRLQSTQSECEHRLQYTQSECEQRQQSTQLLADSYQVSEGKASFVETHARRNNKDNTDATRKIHTLATYGISIQSGSHPVFKNMDCQPKLDVTTSYTRCVHSSCGHIEAAGDVNIRQPDKNFPLRSRSGTPASSKARTKSHWAFSSVFDAASLQPRADLHVSEVSLSSKLNNKMESRSEAVLSQRRSKVNDGEASDAIRNISDIRQYRSASANVLGVAAEVSCNQYYQTLSSIHIDTVDLDTQSSQSTGETSKLARDQPPLAAQFSNGHKKQTNLVMYDTSENSSMVAANKTAGINTNRNHSCTSDSPRQTNVLFEAEFVSTDLSAQSERRETRREMIKCRSWHECSPGCCATNVRRTITVHGADTKTQVVHTDDADAAAAAAAAAADDDDDDDDDATYVQNQRQETASAAWITVNIEADSDNVGDKNCVDVRGGEISHNSTVLHHRQTCLDLTSRIKSLPAKFASQTSHIKSLPAKFASQTSTVLLQNALVSSVPGQFPAKLILSDDTSAKLKSYDTPGKLILSDDTPAKLILSDDTTGKSIRQHKVGRNKLLTYKEKCNGNVAIKQRIVVKRRLNEEPKKGKYTPFGESEIVKTQRSNSTLGIPSRNNTSCVPCKSKRTEMRRPQSCLDNVQFSCTHVRHRTDEDNQKYLTHTQKSESQLFNEDIMLLGDRVHTLHREVLHRLKSSENVSIQRALTKCKSNCRSGQSGDKICDTSSITNGHGFNGLMKTASVVATRTPVKDQKHGSVFSDTHDLFAESVPNHFNLIGDVQELCQISKKDTVKNRNQPLKDTHDFNGFLTNSLKKIIAEKNQFVSNVINQSCRDVWYKNNCNDVGEIDPDLPVIAESHQQSEINQAAILNHAQCQLPGQSVLATCIKPVTYRTQHISSGHAFPNFVMVKYFSSHAPASLAESPLLVHLDDPKIVTLLQKLYSVDYETRQIIMIKVQFFKAWQSYTVSCREHRGRQQTLAHTSVRWCVQKLLTSHFATWRVKASDSCNMRRAVALCHFHVLRKGLLALRWSVKQSKHLSSLLQVKVHALKVKSSFQKWKTEAAKQQQEHLRNALHRWRHFVSEIQKIRNVTEIVHENVKTDVLRCWRKMFNKQVKKHIVYSLTRKTVLQHTFVSWRVHYSQQKEKRDKYTLAVSRHQHRLLKSSFQHIVASFSKAQKARVYVRQHRLSQIFWAWKKSIQVCCVERQAELTISREHWEKQTQKRCFVNWKESQVFNSAVKTANMNLCRKSFLMWKQAWERNLTHYQTIATTMTHIKLHYTLLTWRENVAQLQRRYGLAAALIEKCYLKLIWQSWKMFMSAKAILRRKAHLHLVVTQHKALASSFSQWQNMYTRLRQEKLVKLLWSEACARQMTRQWKLICYRRSLLRLCEATQPGREHLMIRAMFVHWVSSLQKHRKQMEQAVDLHKHLEKCRLLFVFESWKTETQRAVTIKPLVHRAQLQLLVEHFVGWRNLVKHKSQCHLTQRSFQTKILHKFFYSWRRQHQVCQIEKTVNYQMSQGFLLCFLHEWWLLIHRKRKGHHFNMLHLLHKTFGCWREKAGTRYMQKVKIKEEEEANLEIKGRYFTIWLENTRIKACLAEQHVQLVLQKHDQVMLSQIFVSWRRHMQLSLIVRMLLEWRQTVKQIKNDKQTIHHFLMYSNIRLVRTLFHRWYLGYTKRKILHQERRHYSVKCALSAAAVWKRKAQETRVLRLTNVFLQWKMASCFQHWKCSVSVRQNLYNTLDTWTQQKNACMLWQYLRKWRTQVRAGQVRKTYTCRFMRTVMAEWRSVAKMSKERHMKCLMLKKATSERHLQVYFQYWLTVTGLKLSVQQNLQTKLLKRMLRSWKQYTCRMHDLRKLQEMFAKHVETCFIRSTFRNILRRADYCISLQEKTNKVIRHKTLAKMRTLFHAWKDKLNEIISFRCYQHILAVRGVHRWHRFVWTRKQMRLQDEQNWNTALDFHNHNICKTMFAALRLVVMVSHLREERRQNLCLKYASLWKLHVDMGSTALVMERGMTLRHVWNKWRYTLIQIQAGQHADELLRDQVMFQVFDAWRGLCRQGNSTATSELCLHNNW